ncbi:MAG: rRNA pseudouridine synthase, partial [Deltaproteobacteria bacterium]|nr:rRNA pseudouridine synthase [Deltaproteobacteria bacterium]
MERLQKVIARAGITSRRKAETLILEGRVTVNRQTVVELGTKVDPERDAIKVDGKPITSAGPLVYILLNKPKGYISSLSDPEKRPVVTDLVKRKGVRVYPVGRLDYDAEGVLLLTNDGELSNRLIHPSFSAPKKYLVKVRGVPDERGIKRLQEGVFLEDGRTVPAKAHLIRRTKENSWIELTVFEGRNRLVKRMCQAIGHPVSKLKRVEFAGIRLGILKPGQYRMLNSKEVEGLRRWGSKKKED